MKRYKWEYKLKNNEKWVNKYVTIGIKIFIKSLS